MQKDDVISRCDSAIAALANGDLSSLEIIYGIMSKKIYAAALAITQDHSDAEDVTQDTMLQIVKYAPSYRQGSNPRAWILTIARHRALDTVRARKHHTPIDELPLADAAVNDDVEAVLELLSPLGADERQLVVLRLYEELSYSEISQIMKTSVFAAQKRYQRAIRKLKSVHDNERSFINDRKRDKRYT